MIKYGATPKTLKQAIDQSLAYSPACMIGLDLRKSVQDYLAQKFQIAYALNKEDHVTMKALEKLWLDIINEEVNENE